MAADPKAKSIALMMMRPKGPPGGAPPGGDEATDDGGEGEGDDGLEGSMVDLRQAMSDGSPEDMAAAFRAAMDAAQG